jgi:predicted nucleic acid-binding protein
MSLTLVDAGPLIALLDRSDPWHDRCREALKTMSVPLLTVWPAFTEAMYLLGASWPAQQALLDYVTEGALTLIALGEADVPRIRELMHKYRDLPMDLADAALVRVAERERISTIFTVDRRDFSVYRPSRIARFRIVP